MLCLYRAENSQILTMPNQGRNVIRLDPFFILRTNRPPLNYLSSMTAWSTIRKSEINLLQLDMNVGFREVHRSIRFQLQSPLWAVSANLATYPLSSRPHPKHRLIIAHPLILLHLLKRIRKCRCQYTRWHADYRVFQIIAFVSCSMISSPRK